MPVVLSFFSGSKCHQPLIVSELFGLISYEKGGLGDVACIFIYLNASANSMWGTSDMDMCVTPPDTGTGILKTFSQLIDKSLRRWAELKEDMVN